MCGIVGYVGRQDALPILFAGLHRLEYRGYDSAGVAVITRGGLKVHKAAGKVRQVEATLPRRLKGSVGIAHTRWATHGEPNDVNAHPHVDCSGNIAVVHNGIIENAAALRAELEAKGHVFRSETDTEVLAHLIEAIGGELDQAVRQALMAIEGTYGIAALDARQPDRIVAARNGSPVVIGLGEREMFVASDVAALVRYTEQVVYLDDREVAVIDAGGYKTGTLDDRPTDKRPHTVQWGHEAYDRGAHEHFMLKEILEQPEACERTLKGRLDLQFSTAHLGGLNLTRARPARHQAHQDPRLRLGVLLGHRRRAPDRGADPRAGRRRGGVGVPLSQSGDREGLPVHRRQSVGRDRRHARRRARGAAQRRARAGHRQRGRQQHRAGLRRRHLHSRRAGGVGGVDQDASPARWWPSRCWRCTSAASAISRRRPAGG